MATRGESAVLQRSEGHLVDQNLWDAAKKIDAVGFEARSARTSTTDGCARTSTIENSALATDFTPEPVFDSG